MLELFAGYGSQALSLENLGIEFTSDISEIDKYAIQAYNQLHGDTHNWGDICKIDETKLPYYDLITYSFPCQDISLAGLQMGLDNDSGTRSSLLWECERIIRAVKPKYLLMENVKNFVGEKHKQNFVKWLNILESIGYQNFWKVLNAKDYGVPQNRERVFVVSILGGGQYLFPNPIKLEKRLKDVLENDVDEKYYLSDRIINSFFEKNARDKEKGNGFKFEPQTEDDVAHAVLAGYASIKPCSTFLQEPIALDEQNKCLRTDGTVGTLTTDGSSPKHNNRVIEPLCVASRGRGNGQELEIQKEPVTNTLTSVQKDNYIVEPKVEQVGNIVNTGNWDNPQAGRVYSDKGLSPTLNTMQGGGREPKIIDDTYANRKPREYTDECPSIRAERGGLKVENNYRIRKLTPRECWRLMGVRDEQFDKLHDLSNTQLYKMAGNSIVVDVLMAIFKNLFITDNETKGQLTLL